MDHGLGSRTGIESGQWHGLASIATTRGMKDGIIGTLMDITRTLMDIIRTLMDIIRTLMRVDMGVGRRVGIRVVSRRGVPTAPTSEMMRRWSDQH